MVVGIKNEMNFQPSEKRSQSNYFFMGPFRDGSECKWTAIAVTAQWMCPCAEENHSRRQRHFCHKLISPQFITSFGGIKTKLRHRAHDVFFYFFSPLFLRSEIFANFFFIFFRSYKKYRTITSQVNFIFILFLSISGLYCEMTVSTKSHKFSFV